MDVMGPAEANRRLVQVEKRLGTGSTVGIIAGSKPVVSRTRWSAVTTTWWSKGKRPGLATSRVPLNHGNLMNGKEGADFLKNGHFIAEDLRTD
jgi:hypothetical protein